MFETAEILDEECRHITNLLRGLDEGAFARPTRCHPWDIKALVAHMWRGLFRIPTVLNDPAPERADTDRVSYWHSYNHTGDAPAIAAHALETAVEYETGADLTQSFAELYERCTTLAEEHGPDRMIRVWWGPQMRLDEFFATRVVDIVIHGFDITDALRVHAVAGPRGRVLVCEVLTELLGRRPPDALGWTDYEFIEKGTGRSPLTERDRDVLDDLAGRFPLFA